MGALLALAKQPHAMSDVPALLNADAYSTATDEQKRVASLRESVIKPLLPLLEAGGSVNKVAQLLVSRLLARAGNPQAVHAAGVLQVLDGFSFATAKRWIADYQCDGIAGLVPRHTGRVRQAYGWELRAVALYNIPSKPGFANVAFKLRQEGFDTASDSRVKRYLKSLPATLGANSPQRVGPHLHKLKHQHFKRRSLDEVLVGEIYAGDGHTCDCYVAHPSTGKPFRPELTMFIDIKSGYPAGWWFSESESMVSTLFALSHALRTYDHVPAWVYIDRGPGYRARLLAEESTGFYDRFSIGVIGAIPGNPHGKGWIERFFRTCRDRHDKFFAGGGVYCGDDMAPETNRRMSAELAQGKRTLPSLAQYVDSFNQFLQGYCMEPQPSKGGRTPAQIWAELVPIAVELEGSVMRPQELATVGRQTVRLHNRHYYAEALALYDGKKLAVEYDLHDDKLVWVYDDKGRYVCEAKLVSKMGVLPTSRLEEGRDRRLKGQEQRLEKKLLEAQARRTAPITAQSQLKDMGSLHTTRDMAGLPGSNAMALPAPGQKVSRKPTPAPQADVTDIDLLNWRKD